MTLDELQQIVALGESATLEFKRTSGQRSRAMETLCGMLNGGGGRVVFGVDQAGVLIGQEIGADTLEQVTAAIRDIVPAVVPDVEVVLVDDRRAAIVLTVPGGGGPYTCRRQPYLRLGPTTSEMPREMYELKIAEKLHNTARWENQAAPADVTVADLDEEEIQRTVQTARNLGRLGDVPTGTVAEILTGLDLMADGRLLNAAVALYARSRPGLFSRFPQLSVRLGRFRGADRTADLADNRDYWGGVFALLRHAERFLADHVHIASRIIAGQMQREDRPAYPPRATREALANAFCHRDYTMAGGAVEVALHDNRLEIGNPGEFHFGITPETLAGPHPSRPWNPTIAGALHRAGVIERWGSGARNMMTWCREGHAPLPTWHDASRTVTVTFLPAERLPDEGRTPQVRPQVGPPVRPQVSKRVAAVVGLLGKHEALDAAGIGDALGIASRKHVRKTCLQPAMAAGLIEMTSPDKPNSRSQQYRLTDLGRQVLAESEASGGSDSAP